MVYEVLVCMYHMELKSSASEHQTECERSPTVFTGTSYTYDMANCFFSALYIMIVTTSACDRQTYFCGFAHDSHELALHRSSHVGLLGCASALALSVVAP